ncbi:MAG: TonB-dependent receptor [Flavobacteriaceae bacterium]|nr:TonB-dependent receptor [Flavobacteriaceae bacterium]
MVLIDGIKTENPQTGHHTMNMMIPLENIERIEIIKGPAARVYGQNAFTGAINIVTKKNVDTYIKGTAALGSFDQQLYEIAGAVRFANSSHQLLYSNVSSDGYRYNTDFKNQNVLLKSKFDTKYAPIDLIATFMARDFGANGFYASPKATDQYEETQASIVGISSVLTKKDFILKPKLYWTRGQDMYEFIRGKPEIYRNHHITNKAGAAVDVSYNSKLGITGIGLDMARVFIASNNLGDHNRTMFTTFLEQRFVLAKEKLDITPGIAFTYYSDFGTQIFPGIDVGYELLKDLKIYGNLGYTYRIPTYTDLFYSDPTTLGNPDLIPESALTGELGIKWTAKNIFLEFAAFYRDAEDLIDYVKENEDEKWQAENIQNVKTKGIEASFDYRFSFRNFEQRLKFGYAFLDDVIKNSDFNYSRYSLNSVKHQVNIGYESQFFKYFRQRISYRYVARPDADHYNVFDASIIGSFKDFELSAGFNNIFSETYTETNQVPMPEFNFMTGLKYTFR